MKPNSPAIVTCVVLTKIYQTGTVALDDLTLTIEPGMSFGLMGENGGGKSTLVKLLMGFIFPTKGQLSVLGETEVRRAHARIGYLHERSYVELRCTARSYLTYRAQLSGYWNVQAQQRVQSVLEQVDLRAALEERLATFSKGMLQRLSIAQTLLADPQFLILDEPTNGLDPYNQSQVRQIIAALHKQGKTILICSHYLNEVEMLCDRVGIMQRVKLVQSGCFSDLVHAQNAVDIILPHNSPASDIVTQLEIQEHVIEAKDNYLHIKSESQSSVLATLVAANIQIQSLNPVSQTLEDIYIRSKRTDAELSSARTYALLARVSSRASYSRGLMLATAALRIPIFLFMLLLVLFAHRLINPTADKMFIGAICLLPTTVLVSVLAVALSSPISTRLTRIIFLVWIALVLFSLSPVFLIPAPVLNILGIVRIPLWPISACYQVSVSGTISVAGVIGMFLVGAYIIGLALIAGKWFERREILFY